MGFGSFLGGFAGGATVSIVISAVDDFSNTFSTASSGLQSMGNIALGSAKLVGTAGATISGALIGIGIKSVQVASDFQQSQIAFETMLGSADAARKLQADIVELARKTPFEVGDLTDYIKRLLAYNIAQEDLIPTMTQLGNIAAGVGTDKLPQLILAFGQVKAAGKLTGAELRQFTEAGVPLLDQLAQQFGVTAGEVQDLISEGKVGFPDVQQAIATMTGEGGKFQDLMEKQATTIPGQISAIKDQFTLMFNEIGLQVIETIQPFIDKFQEVFTLFKDSGVITTFKDAIVDVGAVVKYLLEKFQGVYDFNMILETAKGLWEGILTAVTTFVSGLDWDLLKQNVANIWKIITDHKDDFITIFKNVALFAVDIANAILKIQDILIKTGLLDAMITGFTVLSDILKIVADIFLGIWDTIQKIVDKIENSRFAGVFNDIASGLNPLSAAGNLYDTFRSQSVSDAIITPSGQVIETSPQDYIMATKDPGSMIGGGITVYIDNLNGMDPDQVAEALQSKLRELVTFK